MGKEEGRQLSRRTFVKGSAITALAATAGAGAIGSLYGCSGGGGTGGGGETPVAEEKVTWSFCDRCGSFCALQYHTVDGVITYLESDNTGNPEFGGLQLRACLKGRTSRRLVNNPARLRYPMKRVGKRGDGEFERISWDEAIDLLAEKLKYTIDTYGNEAVYIGYGSRTYSLARLMNMLGGFVNPYGNYSVSQLSGAMPYTFGGMPGSALREAANADLIVLFGNNPCGTAMGGAGGGHDLAWVRAQGTKVVNIDYRLNETSAGYPDEWIPIRPGTDAALASALCFVFINEGFADEEFLHSHCVGYDETNMPEGAPGNSSYKDYILGTGYDMIPKTPEWASPITQIPVEKIYELAREIGNANSVYVCQGWGSQRHSNGENTCRAIAMVPIISGHIGLPGTNTGCREADGKAPVAGFPAGVPAGDNPVTTRISYYSWVDAIDHGSELTALHDGVRGKDKLEVGIKFMWGPGANWYLNQNGDINRTSAILTDESKCEFIVLSEIVMTDSAKYADLLLPELYLAEMETITGQYAGFQYFNGVIFGQKAVEPQFEGRAFYDIVAALAEKFNLQEQYTEGRTATDWVKHIYEQAREKDPELPTYEDGVVMGIYKKELSSTIALAGFREDPIANPLTTPSGLIEIYSTALADIAATWEFDNPTDYVTPIPVYQPGHESYEDVTDEFPYVLSGFHFKGRANSSYGNVDILQQANRQQVWINPLDAKAKGIKNGDMTRVSSLRGTVEIEARVTPRIIPGVLAIPQGSWHEADMNGDKIDKGGCVNTLTSQHPTPLTKGNPQHNSIAQIEKL